MERVRMEVIGLTSSPQNSGAYALILQETGAERRMSILIGQDLAQAIALEMEAIQPPRPITHDLMKKVIETLGSTLVDITITDLKEGTFYAVIRLDGTPTEIDARPSDAIALAIRFGAPIYVYEEVLANASIQIDDDEFYDSDDEYDEEEEEDKEKGEERPLTLLEQLQLKLKDAVQREDYEKAAQIRDELDRIDKTKRKPS
ncbi:MAG: bifunctional nuclease family protein [Ignavibacteriae bacterium]|nr:bifunctional nuclease family protein [Ignavibacteriota bacterium]MCB9216944.1 bifunctional nuclease family protein [Ignavibacteria bacterium]